MLQKEAVPQISLTVWNATHYERKEWLKLCMSASPIELFLLSLCWACRAETSK